MLKPSLWLAGAAFYLWLIAGNLLASANTLASATLFSAWLLVTLLAGKALIFDSIKGDY